MHRTVEIYSNPNTNLSESWRTSIRTVLFVNALCIPAPQEGVEDLLIASAVFASKTPEGKGGLGSNCTKDKDCAGGLFCDPGTKTCTEGGILLNGLCTTIHHPPQKEVHQG